MQFLVPLDMSKNEIRNALIHVLAADPGSPTEGQVYYNSVSKTFRFYTGTAWVTLGRLDQVSAPTAAVDVNNQKITTLATPTAPTDAANKAYVDGVAQGIAWKASVRAATTVAGTLATAFANGQVIDGVTLATGDRILLKNQAAGGENGIYTVNAAGAPTRATDADTGPELLQAAVLVQEGTTQADGLWVNSTNGPITIGTTATVWVQIGGATAYLGGAGLTLTGNVFAVGAGTGITVNADDVALTVPVTVPNGGTGLTALTAKGVLVGAGASPVAPVTGTAGQVLRADGSANPAFGAVDLANGSSVTGLLPVANGGTGATTAAAARAALGVPGKYAASVGNGALTSIAVVHNLGTTDVVAMVFAVSGGAKVYPDVTVTDANTVTLTFAVAPTTNQYRCVVIG